MAIILSRPRCIMIYSSVVNICQSLYNHMMQEHVWYIKNNHMNEKKSTFDFID